LRRASAYVPLATSAAVDSRRVDVLDGAASKARIGASVAGNGSPAIPNLNAAGTIEQQYA
jgi:hypothetical protein